MREKITHTLGAVCLAAVAGTAYAGGNGGTPGTITSGDASYTFLGFDSNGSANWTPGGALSGNQLFQSWWWFRADNQSQEYSVGNGLPDVTVYAGDTATFTGTESDRGDSGQVGLDYTMVWSIDGATDSLRSTLTVTNTTDDPITLNIFNYADIDLNGAQGDSATVDANGNIFVEDSATPGAFIRYSGDGPDQYQVEPRADLLNSLNDNGITTLNGENNVTSPGDFTAAFQWEQFVLPAGEAEDFVIGFTVVPAPGAAGLMGLAGVMVMRRRRR